MNTFKLILILMLTAVAAVASLWVLGFIGEDAAQDMMKRSVGVVAILGALLGAILLLTRKPKARKTASSTINQGPKF
jgi:hypothetical protein